MPQFQNLRANIPAPICPGTDSPPRRNFLLRGAGPASPFPRLAPGAPLPPAPRPFSHSTRPAHASFPAPTFPPHLPKNRNQPLPSDLLWQAPPLLFAPPPSPIPQPLTPYAPRRPLRPPGIPALPPVSAPAASFASGVERACPSQQRNPPTLQPHSPPCSLRPCAPSLRRFLRPAPSLRAPLPSPPVPQSSAFGLEPPYVSPCSRAAFLPHPHSRRIPRIPDRTASLLPAPSVPEYGPVLLFPAKRLSVALLSG